MECSKEHIEISKVMGTKDIEFFEEHKFNRVILGKKYIEILKKSIREDGQLDPIKVTIDGKILDGHHRFEAIKSLKETHNADLLIKYITIETQDEIDLIIKLNSISKKWSIEDFIRIYAIDNDEYKKIIEIATKYNQSISSVLSTLSCGNDVARYRELVKMGKDLNFENWNLLEEYYKWIGELKYFIHLLEKGKPILFRLYIHENFNRELFHRNAKKEFISKNEKVRFSNTQNICKRQLLELYNKGQNKKSENYIHYVLDADNKIILK